MKNLWVNKAHLFSKVKEFDTVYYLKMSKIKRLETLQLLREIYYKIKPDLRNEGRKGLRRIIKVIQ